MEEERQLPPWILTADDEWEFSLPPYRGVLIIAKGNGNEGETYVHALIETPEGTVTAPQPFGTITDAQVWVESEIYHRMVESGHELRRHGPGRREHNHN